MKNMKLKGKKIWKTGFGQRYIDTIAVNIKPETTEEQTSFMENQLDLHKGDAVLDAGCGQGRNSIEFAKRGYGVTGFDYSEILLTYAKKKAQEQNLKVSFTQGDLKSLPFKDEFDAVILMLAFGFLDSDEDNLLVMKNISQALKSHGKIFMVVSNSIPIISKMMSDPDVKDEKGALSQIKEITRDNIIIHPKMTFDIRTMKYTSVETWEKDSKTHKEVTVIRIFTIPEIVRMAKQSGLVIKKIWGDFDESDFSAHSPLMLFLMEKE